MDRRDSKYDRIEIIVPVARERIVTVRDDAPLVDAASFSMASTSILSLSATRPAPLSEIITRTDIVRQMALCQGCGCTAAAATVMTKDIAYCRPGDLLHDVWSIMKEKKLLHVPIVGDDLRPLGVINARDALLVLLEGSEYKEGLLRDYVMGIGYR